MPSLLPSRKARALTVGLRIKLGFSDIHAEPLAAAVKLLYSCCGRALAALNCRDDTYYIVRVGKRHGRGCIQFRGRILT